MKIEDVKPRARRAQHRGQVASYVAIVGLNKSGEHMVVGVYLIYIGYK